jgi:hypothetical protein
MVVNEATLPENHARREIVIRAREAALTITLWRGY